MYTNIKGKQYHSYTTMSLCRLFYNNISKQLQNEDNAENTQLQLIFLKKLRTYTFFSVLVNWVKKPCNILNFVSLQIVK